MAWNTAATAHGSSASGRWWRRGRHCPWCDEAVAARQVSNASDCPHCGRALRDDGGQPLRAIDLRYGPTVERQRLRARKLLLWGGGAAVVVFGLLPLAHLAITPVAAVPLVIVGHLIVLRVYLVRDATRLLGGARRAFGRWLTRLSVLWLGSFGYGLTVLPLAGVVAGVATFAGLTAGVHAYTRWSLERELRRLPLTGWERATLAILALLTVAAIVVALGLALLVGWSLSELQRLF